MKLKINITKKGAIISLSVLIATVLTDFFTKLAVMNNMELYQSIPIIKDVLHLTYILNPGAAFGSFSDQRWVFMILSTLLIAFLIALILIWDEGDALFYTAASMVLGGGIGNMIDRIAYGEVVDFIDFCAFPNLWQWIFNGADSFVCVGAGLLMLWYILAEIKSAKKKRSKASEEKGNDGE
jgi:signal peptidase II